MVSTSPRLCCSSCSRLSGEREDRAGAGAGNVVGPPGEGAKWDAGKGGPQPGTQGNGKRCFSGASVRGVAGRKGGAKREVWPRGRY